MTVQKPVAGPPAPAAARWLEEHGDVLYSYAMARLKNAAAAEDLVQDTLLAAMEGHDRFAGQSTVRTWLVGILRHKLLEHYRKRKVEISSFEVDHEMPASIGEREFTRKGRWKDGPKKWGDELKSQAEEDDFRVALRRCLEKLPASTAEAFVMAECDDVPIKALQQALNISTANHVYVLLHRARAALRQCLERGWFGASAGKR